MWRVIANCRETRSNQTLKERERRKVKEKGVDMSSSHIIGGEIDF